MSSLSIPVRVRLRRRRTKDSVSNLAFRVNYPRRSREIYRRYLEPKPWLSQLYTSFLNIRRAKKIVDVGCGTGDFTRRLHIRSSGDQSSDTGWVSYAFSDGYTNAGSLLDGSVLPH